MRQINESLSYKDLENLVSNVFTIDVYKSKAFDDESTIVLSFDVKGKLPADDLEKFIEKGYKVLDAENEISADTDNQYTVFVEMQREPLSCNIIDEMLDDLLNLVEFERWKFKYYKETKIIPYDSATMLKLVPFSKREYQERYERDRAQSINEFIGDNILDGISLTENIVTFHKNGQSLNYELIEHDIDTTKIELDAKSLRECRQLDKFLHRNVLIHKADGCLVLNKNNSNRRIYLKSL